MRDDFIKRYFAGAGFFPEEVEIFVAAFDDAWAKLQVTRAPFAEDAYDAREILAKHIIMSAQRGERNRRQLADDALLHVSEQLSGEPVWAKKAGRPPVASVCDSQAVKREAEEDWGR
jgi:hypothetical protein